MEFNDKSENYNLECNMHRGYFDSLEFEINSDCSDHEKEEEKYIEENYLRVNYKPKIIYDNYDWVNEKFKHKYECYFNDLKIDLSRVKRITKEQIRRLR